MCTAITFRSQDHYFGRNLDLEYSYSETVTVTPRRYPFVFRNGKTLSDHYALIGMATVSENYPLYYEATNEAGLSLAGLNFPGNAVYLPAQSNRVNITPFELIPWILGQCRSVEQALDLLERINIWNEAFSDALPLSPLHWLLADEKRAVVIEPTEEGLKLYEDSIGVLTNNPPFPYHMYNLANYLNLTADTPVNRFAKQAVLTPYSLGMGAIGLPGDLSSASRFVRAAFTKLNSQCGQGEDSSVSQFFHILGSVAQTRGLTHVKEGKYEITLYSSCCNTTKGIYYYTTYDNSRITAVRLHGEDLDSSLLVTYPLDQKMHISFLN